MAALAGFLGPILKWLDPSATEYGRGAELCLPTNGLAWLLPLPQ